MKRHWLGLIGAYTRAPSYTYAPSSRPPILSPAGAVSPLHMASNLHTVLAWHELYVLRALGRSGVTLRAHDVIRNAPVAHGCDPVRQGRLAVGGNLTGPTMRARP